MTKKITMSDRRILLQTARETIRIYQESERVFEPDLEGKSAVLTAPGASFVTLTKQGILRGCVGTLTPVQALILDVRDRALGAAFQDFRFPPLTESELKEVVIEVSRLTPPQALEYSSPADLLQKLAACRKGVVLSYQERKATFLPQVWEKLTTPEIFLERLCLKMGLSARAWQELPLKVEVYQVEKFSEQDFDFGLGRASG